MNDRFSFKAWDKEKKIMYQAAFIDFYRIVCYEIVEDRGMYINFSNMVEYDISDKNLVIIQCTGLKDKNGRLIFEGDIIAQMEVGYDMDDNEIEIPEVIGFVEWRGEEHYPAFEIVTDESHYFECNAFSHLFAMDENIIVIGNIYENPELLETTK